MGSEIKLSTSWKLDFSSIYFVNSSHLLSTTIHTSWKHTLTYTCFIYRTLRWLGCWITSRCVRTCYSESVYFGGSFHLLMSILCFLIGKSTSSYTTTYDNMSSPTFIFCVWFLDFLNLLKVFSTRNYLKNKFLWLTSPYNKPMKDKILFTKFGEFRSII